jgi:diadenosine tetraphosphate (Ap4A) HIT family hydrolase
MVEHCIFCRIARNEAPASLVYDDNKVIAFLDAKPVNEGHTLVVTRNHYLDIYEAPDAEVAHLFKIVKKVAYAVKKSEKADGISIFQNNGRAADQVVLHLHVHVIPRYEGRNSQRDREIVEQSRLDVVAARIMEFI